MATDDYSLAEPFGIDDGELDGLTPQQIFALGVEFQMVRQELATGEQVDRTVHTANADRLKAMCERHGRRCKLRWLHDDHETWRQLIVEAM